MTHCQTCSCRDLGEAFAPRRPDRPVTAEGAAMTPLSETEAATVARFEAAPPAPESWRPCPQAWHGGLYAGLLEECKYQARHRGRHRNKRGDLEWGGELSGAEVAQADKLRAAR